MCDRAPFQSLKKKNLQSQLLLTCSFSIYLLAFLTFDTQEIKMHMDMNKGDGGCKKRKRGDKVFKFWAFCEPGYPSNFDGPFHRNIRALLEFGHLEDSGLGGGMQSWSFQLELYRHPPVIVSLFVVEEAVEKSRYRRCNQCRYVGKSQHGFCYH